MALATSCTYRGCGCGVWTAIHQSTVMAPDEERAVLTTHTDDQERNLLLTHLNNNPTCKMKMSQPLTEPNQDQFPSLCTEFATAQTHQSLHHCRSARTVQPHSLRFLKMKINGVVWGPSLGFCSVLAFLAPVSSLKAQLFFLHQGTPRPPPGDFHLHLIDFNFLFL